MLKRIFAPTILFIAATLGSSALAAEDHGAATLSGEHLNLVYVDHTIAGSIADHPLYASPLENGFGIRLTHRASEQDFQSVFTKDGDGSMRGELNSVDATGTKRATVFTVTEALPAEGIIRGTLDNDTFEITITSDGVVDHHFVNPVYNVNLSGKSYTYKLENGRACIGCSMKISYVVLGMLRVNGKI